MGVSLALGSDLTTLGLNLNSPEPLYNNFGGPWAENPCRPQDIDFHVPPEYLTNAVIRDKLASVKLNRYQEDLLFYLFYTNVGDANWLLPLNSTTEIGAIIRRRGCGSHEFLACRFWTKRRGSNGEPIIVSTLATGAKWPKKCSPNTKNSKTDQEIYKCQQACSLLLKASN